MDGRWYSGVNVLEAFLRGQVKDLFQVFLLPDPKVQTLYAITSSSDDQNANISPMVNLDVVFPVLHGTFGEDGTLQGLFDLANMAYVGAGLLGSAIGMDKGVFMDVMRAYNMPVVDTLVFRQKEISRQIDHVMDEAEKLSPYPLFVNRSNFPSFFLLSVQDLSINLLRDDGGIVYLNGAEIFRSNLPDGPVNYLTLATNAVAGAEETLYFQKAVAPALLREGRNVLAVEIHQSSPSSSDVSFDLSLTGIRTFLAPAILVQPGSAAVPRSTSPRAGLQPE